MVQVQSPQTSGLGENLGQITAVLAGDAGYEGAHQYTTGNGIGMMNLVSGLAWISRASTEGA